MHQEGRDGGRQGGMGPGGGTGGGDERCDEAPQDHVDYTAGLWEAAFWMAMEEVRVELLKERIRSVWGKNMEKTAQKVAEAAFAEWKKFREEEEEKAKSRKGREAPGGVREWIKEALKKGPQ